MFDLHEKLIAEFNFDNSYISVWSLYKYMKKMSFTHKKIIYKVQNANTYRIKEIRSQIAIEILTAHLKGFHFMYIDEISFNLDLRPSLGWSLIGHPSQTSKPPKSKNYSVIACMDINGIVAVKIIKGGVKSQDFFSYVSEITIKECPPYQTRKLYC